jgi:hypothetical protein
MTYQDGNTLAQFQTDYHQIRGVYRVFGVRRRLPGRGRVADVLAGLEAISKQPAAPRLGNGCRNRRIIPGDYWVWKGSRTLERGRVRLVYRQLVPHTNELDHP